MENYEERYKEALERAQKMQENSNGMILKKWLWGVFPELKENESKRIRKGLIKAVSRIFEGNKLFDTDVTREEALAWLEKQGEQTHAKLSQQEVTKTSDQELSDKIEPKFKAGDWIVINETTYQIIEIDNSHVVLSFNGRECNFGLDVFSNARLWTIQDAKEGDVLVDEDNNIGLYSGEKDDLYWHSCIYLGCDGYIRGGFRIGGYHKYNNTKPATKEQRVMLFHKMKEAGFEWNAEKKELKEIEQKSENKTETKFKVGNWYQCTKNFFGKGVTFDKNTAYYCAIEGCLLDGCHIAIVKDLYDNFKLWTIQDAKDGDVLAINWHEDDDSWEKIIIFKKYHNKGVKGLYSMPCVEGYGNTFKNGKLAFQEEIPYYSKTWTSNLHPATKEQRDLLFEKMKEAGYEWDSDKKELKKIEPKKLDADKVIEWLKNTIKETEESFGYNDIYKETRLTLPYDSIEDFINDFKEDFGLC